jgi:hypothetical protein
MEKEEKAKKTRERSTPYPGVPLEKAIAMVAEIKVALGKGPYSRTAAAQALGHSTLTGPAARKVAALVHYGLLDRSGGDAYVLGKTVNDILHPISEDQRRGAIALAAVQPKLFSKLIQQYSGQGLPRMLSSILIRDGVSSGAAEEVATIFSETLSYAGLLKNGVISGGVPIVATTEDTGPSEQVVALAVSPAEQSTPVHAGYMFSDSGDGWSLTIKAAKPLNSNIRKALIDLTEKLEDAKIVSLA